MTQTAKKSPFSMNVDLMHGPIFKNLLLFMLPILISNLFQQLYNTVDTMIVGNVLGDTALAAIGACGAIYELLVGFGIGIGNGLAIVAARSYGAGDDEQLKQTVAGSIVIGLIASAVITLAGAMGLHPLLELLDTPGILWPKFEDRQVGMNLAYTGAVRDEIMDLETLACHLAAYLGKHYPQALAAGYKLSVLPEREAEENDAAWGYRLLESAGRKRGFLISGGEVDTERAARILLDEFRGGRLGRFTLELPEEQT